MLDAIRIAGDLAEYFVKDQDFEVDLQYRVLRLTEAGLVKLDELSASFPGMWKGRTRREELITQALSAREFYHLDKHYVVQEGKITIVDEFTGRLMTSRSWGQGLHQAVEAKEGLELTHPTETVVRLSFQHFFRLFRQISGMTGTAKEAAGEFWQVYRLPVMSLPTNVPCRREMLPERVFQDESEKWDGVVDSVMQVHAKGQPVLVGTRNIHESEKLARTLVAAGARVELLNARRVQEEAGIIAQAGRKGQITIATNMAGRGTDIRLEDGVGELGGLHVIVSERHDSGRIDRQLVGRCARQGDPGSAQLFTSVEDSVLVKHTYDWLRYFIRDLLTKHKSAARWLLLWVTQRAQKNAETLSFRQRKNVLRVDTWLEQSLTFGDPEKMS
jgi:preprotein translocase subunit SecA